MTAVNDAPIAQSQTVSVASDKSITINLSGSDPESDPLTYKITSKPQHGVLQVTSNKTVIYKPTSRFIGEDFFWYTANDSHLTSAPAKVVIQVHAPVRDTRKSSQLSATGILSGTETAVSTSAISSKRSASGRYVYYYDSTGRLVRRRAK